MKDGDRLAVLGRIQLELGNVPVDPGHSSASVTESSPWLPARVLDDVPERPDPFLFHSPRGKPLLKGTHGWSLQKVKARAGVETRWHDLRHFCATQLLELWLSHFDVSIQLGTRMVVTW